MNPESFLILKTFPDDFITGVYYRLISSVLCLDRNCLKIYPGHVGLLTDEFFLFFFNSVLKGSFSLWIKFMEFREFSLTNV